MFWQGAGAGSRLCLRELARRGCDPPCRRRQSVRVTRIVPTHSAAIGRADMTSTTAPEQSALSRPVSRQARQAVSRQGASAGTSTGVNILPGSDDDGWIIPNRVSLADRTTVQLYKDGEALHAAYNAVAGARRRVCLQVYTFYSDATGRSFAELLSARARAGVEVRFLYDSFGSAGTEPSLFSRMRAAGVHILEFHPWNPLT